MKKVPIYLNINEMGTLTEALRQLHMTNCITKESVNLLEKLKEEIESNSEE